MSSLAYYISRLRRHRHPFRYALARLLVRTPLSSMLTINCEAYRLRFHPTALSSCYWADPHTRHGDEAFLAEYLRPGDTVVDVGANIGALALAAAAAVGEKGHVLAVEPHPRSFRFLESNVALNPFRVIDARNVAVGDSPCRVRLTDSMLDDQNRIVPSGGIPVPSDTLDNLCRGLGPIALLIVDTEGYELPVLKGARETLARVDAIYFEAWENHFDHYGYTLSDVLSLLTSCDFRVFRLGTDDRLQEIPSGYRATDCVNLIAVHNVVAFSARTGRRIPM